MSERVCTGAGSGNGATIRASRRLAEVPSSTGRQMPAGGLPARGGHDGHAWVKRGCILSPSGCGWMHSHAALPTVLSRHQGLVDVYYCSRDAQARSHIGRFTFDVATRAIPVSVSEAPLLSPGPLGAFDDSGVTPACIIRVGARLYLYYTGWMLGRTVPFYYAIGLAISHDEGRTFRRMSRAPILDRNDTDPFLTASPVVLYEDNRWRMWYVSGVRWEQGVTGPRHYYHIKYAESDDGVHWRREGRICIDFANDREYAIARPSVVRDAKVYRMWFPHRGESYRIGYAESADGLTWRRFDGPAGIDVSPEGWDSEMVTYPAVFDHMGSRYMLYNGNGYGRSGIGLAQLIRKE